MPGIGRRGAEVADRCPDSPQPVLGFDLHRQFGVQVGAAADQPAAVDLFDLTATGDGERIGVCPGPDVQRSEGKLTFHGLIPGEVGRFGHPQFADGFERVAHPTLHGAVLQVQEPHHDVQRGIGSRVQQQVGTERVVLTESAFGCPGRAQYTELPAGLVLPGRGAVRVEQVTLVEHRVGDGAGMIPSGFHRSSLASHSSSVIASSKPSSPRADRKVASASKVSRVRRSQPAAG